MPWEFHPEPGVVRWRVHFHSEPEVVYRFLATDQGRESFWAEESKEIDGVITWAFTSGAAASKPVIEKTPSTRFACEYFDDSIVEFDLEADGRGGTDVTLTNRDVPDEALVEVTAGWVSVLLNMKAVVDNAVDLRNHEVDLSWDRGFVDN
jgi:hypothetical protein